MLGAEHAEESVLTSQALLNNDLYDAEDSSDSERVPSPNSAGRPSQQTKKKALVFSDDDDDDSDSDREERLVRSDDDDEDNHVRNGTDSDGEDKTSPRPDPSERAKSKRKGKTPREKKPRKQKRSEVQDIHSESQRIVRESSLRLPYHKPVRKSIDDFFKKKPSTAQSTALFLKPVPLKGTKKLLNGSTSKHTTISSSQHSKTTTSNITLSNKPTKLTVNTKITRTVELTYEDTAPDTDDDKSLKLPTSPVEDFPIVENWLKNIQSPKKEDDTDKSAVDGDDSDDVEDDSLHLTGILSSQEDEDEEESKGCMNIDTKEIVVDSAKDKCVQPDDSDSDIKTKLDSIQPVAKSNSVLGTDGIESKPNGDFTTFDIDRLIDDANGGNQISEDAAAEMVNQENSGECLSKDAAETDQPASAGQAGNHDVSQAVVDEDNSQTPITTAGKLQSPSQDNNGVSNSVPSVNPPTDAASSSAIKTPLQAMKTKRQLLLEASMEKLKAFTPRLQGSPEAVINLEGSGDEGKETPVLNPGVNKLKHRFEEHSKKRAGKKKRQVEISVVSKEVDKDGKEDLRMDKVLTTLEADEEDIDSSLKIPGAKLLLLKDTLQAKMKRKREESRQARQAAYRLDNELGEDDEEEAKADADLTDQTDTDYDPEEDNIKDSDGQDIEGEIDEEMDEEDYDDEEPVRKKFVFGDEEADVDDDDEEEEGYEDEDGEPLGKVDEIETGAMASGEESSDEEDDMERRKVTPSRLKRKKRQLLDEDDEDDEEEEEEKMVLKIPADEPETKMVKKLKDPLNEPSENSRLSAASSAKASHVTKSSSVSIGFTLDGSKTMDMFDSNTNLTSNADTTDGNNKTADVSPTEGESIGFSWSALKERNVEEENRDTGSLESGQLKLDSTHSNSLDNSFEMFGSLIPGHQPEGGMRHTNKSANASDHFTPFSKQKSLLYSAPRSTSKLSELTMPVEDSQDLFREESPLPSLGLTDSQRATESQSFHFSFEDETQSQFLDENGFINVRPPAAKPKPSAKKLFSGESNATQGNMSELLGLCSGQFTEGTQGAPRSSSPRTFQGTGPFSQISKGLAGTQGGDMDELLGLCSGTFAKTQGQDKVAEVTNPITKEKRLDEDNSEASFHLISDNEGFRSDNEEGSARFKGLSSDEDDAKKMGKEEDGIEEDEEKSKKRRRIRMVASSDEEGEEGLVTSLKVKKKKSKGFSFPQKKKSKMTKTDFVEAEAELSGSEFDSDENYDAEEFGDELEMEAADAEDVGNEDDLRDQVNKVHMKAIDDDDARRLRIYKELLLPDGDLHSDNKGRQRQFKWRNLNNYEDSLTDMFNDNSDGEGVDVNQDEDTQWRMQRFEREQWLKDNKKTIKQPVDSDDDDDNIVPAEEENSQFVKFMKAAVLGKTKKVPVSQSAADTAKVQQTDIVKGKRVGSPKKIKLAGKSHGSFLHRKKDVAKMAATKAVVNPTGSGMARQFVFQTMSPPKPEGNNNTKLKRSNSVTGSMAPPKSKRPRLERSQSNMSQNSIFSHLQ